MQHILPAGSLSDYLSALGLAWQPAQGGEETREGIVGGGGGGEEGIKG